jgi:hypothetical protein
VVGYPSREACDAAKRLLDSTSSIASLELEGFYGDERSLLLIFQGLIDSLSVTDMAFAGCRLNGGGSTLLFKSILQSKSNIRSLRVKGCSVSEGVLSAEDFIQLFRSDSSLRSFELSGNHLDRFGFSSLTEFKALLEAVKKSKLELFSIGKITDQDMCQELVSSIPKMPVSTLQFGWAESLDRFKLGLLSAVKANSSLYSVAQVEFRRAGRMLFNEDDKRQLNYYASRNKGLSRWLASPPAVPREAWPSALAAVRVTGPGTFYRILRKLGDSVGPVEGTRKRKHHPTLDAP